MPETDPHPRYTGSQPAVSSRTPSALLGLLGTVGGGLAVLVGYLAITSGGDETKTPAAAVEPAKAEAPASVEGKPDAPAVDAASALGAAGTATAAGVVLVEPAPEPTPEPERKTPAELVQPVPSEPAPPEPKPASKPASKPATKPATKPAAPLTDAKVQAQLARTLKKKCASLGAGTKTTVSLMVASKGNVLSTLLKASPELKKCIAAEAEKTKFPAGETRTVRFDVAF